MVSDFRLSYGNYLALRQAAGMDPEEDMPEDMWEDTPRPMRVADIEVLEEEAKKFQLEEEVKKFQMGQASIMPSAPRPDKPESEVIPW